VITLQGLAIVQNTRDLSLLFTGVGITGLLASFLIPELIGRISRRWTYTLGCLLLIAAAVALATLTLTGQALGMLIRVFGVACINISTSLYIMQYINKRELTRAEPRRLLFSALAWTAGPSVGVALYQLEPAWTYALSASAAAVQLGFFWWLRLHDNPALPRSVRPPPRPWQSVGRFISQPRLRLAWLIPFGRSSWWVFFFIYAPVYMVYAGYGELAGALVVSLGNAMLFLTPVFGRLGMRHGLRPLLLGAHLGAGTFTIAAGLSFALPLAPVLLLLAAALCCAVLDAMGNIPFLRSVRPYERAQMTAVFRTYIDVSELLPPAFYALLLTFFPLPAVFVAAGLINIALAYWIRYLPRSM
jgi:MFS family permease